MITIVGFEKAHRVQWGIAHEEQSWPELGTPVLLDPGEALRADFHVKAPYGSLAISALGPAEPLKPWNKPAYAFVSGERAGSVLFVASEQGPHGYSAEPTALHGAPACPAASRRLASAILPARQCPTLDVDYQVRWHRVSREEALASPLPRLVIPAQGEPLASKTL